MAIRTYSECMPIVLFIAGGSPQQLEQHSGKMGELSTCGFLLFEAQTHEEPRADSRCVGASRRGQFPQSDYKAVYITKVVEDVNGDAQTFASR